jgi:tRNA(Ile)-lysidine synthase
MPLNLQYRSMKLDLQSFSQRMEQLWPHRQNDRFAVGVSGGSDSLALAVLCKEWFANRGATIEALVVDHGLREESQAEAVSTVDKLNSLGIEVSVLNTDAKAYKGSFQLKARQARFDALTSYCNQHSIKQLLLGHNLDDQIETFLLRLESGSQLMGLAAMPAIAGQLPDLSLWRPLLPFPKRETADYLRTQGLDWVEDPSNQKTVNSRIWFRQNRDLLANEGISSKAIVELVNSLGHWRGGQQNTVNDFVAEEVEANKHGWISLKAGQLSNLSPLLRSLLFTQLLSWVRNGFQALSGSNLLQLERWISTGYSARPMTIGGCLLLYKSDKIVICREERNIPKEVSKSEICLVWDQRFLIESTKGRSLTIRPLGKLGWSSLTKQERAGLREAMPIEAAYTLPCFSGPSSGSPPQLLNLQQEPSEMVADRPRLTFLSNTNLLTPVFLVV